MDRDNQENKLGFFNRHNTLANIGGAAITLSIIESPAIAASIVNMDPMPVIEATAGLLALFGFVAIVDGGDDY